MYSKLRGRQVASCELRGERAADALVWLIFAADAVCDRFRAVSS